MGIGMGMAAPSDGGRWDESAETSESAEKRDVTLVESRLVESRLVRSGRRGCLGGPGPGTGPVGGVPCIE